MLNDLPHTLDCDPALWQDFVTLCRFGGRVTGTPGEAAARDFEAFCAEVRPRLRSFYAVAFHPDLPRESSVALSLKTVGGLSVREIARAFLMDEQAVAQRVAGEIARRGGVRRGMNGLDAVRAERPEFVQVGFLAEAQRVGHND